MKKLLSTALMLMTAGSASAATDMHRLIWNDDPTSTMTVAWRQLSSTAKVYYDEVDHAKQVDAYAKQMEVTSKNDHLGLKTHFSKLQGLKPDTRYYFLIADEDSVSRRYYFQTSADKPTDFTFIAGGDTKSKKNKGKKNKKNKKSKSETINSAPPAGQVATEELQNDNSPYYFGRLSNRMVAKLRPLFVLFVGDFTSNSDVAERWIDWFRDWNKDTCSEDGRMYPLVPVHGNHENPNGLKDLQNLFGTPESVYYTIDIGGKFMRVFVLNTELSAGKGMTEKIDDLDERWQAQTQWLEKALQNSGEFQYRAAMYHKPMRPHTRNKKVIENLYTDWAPLFAKNKLNLSFDGDSHLHKITYPMVPDANGEDGFRRDDVNGTMYIGEGSWGAKPRAANVIRDWTMSHGNFNQFKWIHVRNNEFNIHTVDTTNEPEVSALADGQEFDYPQGVKLFDTPGMGTIIKYPFAK